MSGILAILRTDGAPADATLAARLVASKSMLLRGPDAHGVVCQGPVALGHTLLRTTRESQHERQPLSLDGVVWIVADGRVDARDDLIDSLSEDARVSQETCDVELILRAYLRWGDACVERLLGDFAFVIWDGRSRRLFCARDHMGVKPFYYASVGRSLLVSSTIESLRLHPDVSARLNDLAIADFLLASFNQDPATTSFHDIQRLPPAHTLTASAERLSIRRYWALPIEDPIYLRRDQDYLDEFRRLVRVAVSDRLRTDRVSVFMSGGIDSSTLAVTACDLLRNVEAQQPVHAFSVYYKSLFKDPEPEYAGIVARHLRIPIHFYAQDEHIGWFPELGSELPEPYPVLMDPRQELGMHADMAEHSRVAFYGEGPDNALLYEWRPHLAYLFGQGRLFRLLADIGKHMLAHRRVPLLPTVPRMLRERRTRDVDGPAIPEWLAPALIRLHKERRRDLGLSDAAGEIHPVRPRAYASLLTSQWQSLFERYEPAQSGASIEVRHPFVDIRMLRFLLRVPALPWSRSKHLVRRALDGSVPETIRRRRKTPLASDPIREQIRRLGPPAVKFTRGLKDYGEARMLRFECSDSPAAQHVGLRFVALSYWLDRSIYHEEVTGYGQQETVERVWRHEEAVREAGLQDLRPDLRDHTDPC